MGDDGRVTANALSAKKLGCMTSKSRKSKNEVVEGEADDCEAQSGDRPLPLNVADGGDSSREAGHCKYCDVHRAL